MIRRYIIVAEDSLKGFDEAIEKLEREWGAEEIEPCEDAISRADTIEKVNDVLAPFIPILCGSLTAIPLEVARAINNMPSVTPTRPKGEWIDTKNKEEWYAYEKKCSICGNLTLDYGNYCSSCGADMRGDADEDSD